MSTAAKVLTINLTILIAFLSSLSAVILNGNNESASVKERGLLHPTFNASNNGTKTLKDFLDLLKRERLAQKGNLTSLNDTLVNTLLRVGNESNIWGNLTAFAELAMNRTGRQFGGGFRDRDELALLLLLKDRDHGRGGGWDNDWPPPWYYQQPQQQQQSGNSNSNLGQTALLTLLGLALIGRMPTQG